MIRQGMMLVLIVAMLVPALMVSSHQLWPSSSPLPTPTPLTALESQPTAQVTAQIFIPAIGTGAHPEDTSVRSPLIPRSMQRWMGRYGSLILILLTLAALVLLRRSKRAS